MLIREFYKTREDGVNLYRSYSDAKMMIHKIDTEEYYPEAIDVSTAPWSYEETDIPIDEKETLEDRDGISDAEFRTIIEEAL